jgi:Carboxypeptidase regulatory-like domain/TonB-dependent Receptor Plug Domain
MSFFNRTNLLACAGLFFVSCAGAQSIRGIVLDGRDGQAVPSAAVRVDAQTGDVRTDSFGRFTMERVDPGPHVLEISLPGYQSVRTEFRVESGETKEFQVSLVPKLLKQSTVVEGTTDPAGPETSHSPAADEFTLLHSDLINLSSVLADDPLRAVQAVSGVASNDDFEARFSLRGADFARTGIFLDGVLLPNALHSLEGSGLLGSSSVFNPALVDELTLYKGAYSSKFADSSAGVVDVRMRDGNRDGYHVRAMANIAQAGAEAEGPAGKACSWIGAFRESYIQSILGDRIPDPSLAFSTVDSQGRVTCHPSAKNTLMAELIDSGTDLDRSGLRKSLNPTELMTANQHLWFGNAAWEYAASSNLLVTNRVAWMQDRFRESDVMARPLGDGIGTEQVWSSDLSWMWKPGNLLSAGLETRNMRANGFTEVRYASPKITLLNRADGNGWVTGGFVEESWKSGGGRLHASLGGRFDHDQDGRQTVMSPQGSFAVRVLPSTELHFGWGQYVQFPAIAVAASTWANSELLPIRSNQASAAVVQRFGMNTKLRVEFYNRQDRDLLLQPALYPRMLAGKVVLPGAMPWFENSGRGYGRGAEASLERRITKGLSGWVSYSYGRSMTHDGVLQNWFPADYDQRHTVNAYAVYAWKPSVTLSSRWTYGSGFPVPGYLTETDGRYFLSADRNGARLPAYRRFDVRMNKTWDHESYKIRLYAEVLNATNSSNYAFGSLNAFDTKKGKADVSIQDLFPILPSVGIVFER